MTVSPPIDAKQYIERFFELRPVFLADADAGKVSEGTIIDWLKKHAPDYEELSKSLGFASVKEELSFMKELIKLLKDEKDFHGYIRTLRRRNDPSQETRDNFIHTLGETIRRLADEGKFSDKNDRHARQIGYAFCNYHRKLNLPDGM